MSDRWNEALEAAAKVCERWADKYRLSTTHRTDDLVAAAMMCSQVILALREADQRGAAEQEAAGYAGTTEHSAQSAPHHPGGQPVAWTTVLSLELAKGAFYASPVNLWAEKGIPIYTHPGGQTLAAKEGNTSEGPREATPTSASLGLLAAAEEERNET